MRYEVEQKHRVDDPAALTQRLAERGVMAGPPAVQSDCYYAHPARDFAMTDEALRIRRWAAKALLRTRGRSSMRPRRRVAKLSCRSISMMLTGAVRRVARGARLHAGGHGSQGAANVSCAAWRARDRRRARPGRRRWRLCRAGIGRGRIGVRRGPASHRRNGPRARAGPIRASQLSGNAAGQVIRSFADGGGRTCRFAAEIRAFFVSYSFISARFRAGRQSPLRAIAGVMLKGSWTTMRQLAFVTAVFALVGLSSLNCSRASAFAGHANSNFATGRRRRRRRSGRQLGRTRCGG